MSKILILPDRITNRIAAGEVVERPASAVKELVENAIDAGSKEIEIEILREGRKLILVRDNGCGMDYDDAIISLERHSTSKIKNAEDLDSISSLGFRGEALASIASVSRLTLTTRTDEETVGTKVEVIGGKLTSVNRFAREKGTTVRVEDLFFNTPARLKFLKSGTVEMRWLIRIATKYALINPDLKFLFVSNGKRLIDVTPVKTIFERAQQLFGESIGNLLIPFDLRDNEIQVYGYSSHTNHQRSNRDNMFFYINGRAVDDKLISYSVNTAYRNLLPSGKYPTVILILKLPYELVDVNVHPTKTEVRFSSPDRIRALIEHAIHSSIIKSSPILEMKSSTDSNMASLQSKKSVDASKFLSGNIPAGTGFDNHRLSESIEKNQDRMQMDEPLETTPEYRKTITSVEKTRSVIPQIDHKYQILPDLKDDVSGINVIGQYDNSFIIAEMHNDLMIIDQHVAHERIRYEELSRKVMERDILSQNLLLPETFDLSAEDSHTLEMINDEIKMVGIEVEIFGEKTWVLKAVPAGFPEISSNFLKELLQLSSEIQKVPGSDDFRKELLNEIIILLSCQGAIKKNTSLSREKMEWLLENLFQCDEPYKCPHGRPVIIKIEKREIFNKFGRSHRHE